MDSQTSADEPCPPPLAWQQVLEAFREESNSFSIESDGNTIAGRSWGTGPPLYFLTGLGGTHELYSLAIWLLRDQFRCVAFDYPNSFSKQSRNSESPVEPLARCLFAVADYHGDSQFHLYATSFGVTVALSCLLMEPDRIGRAILQGGFARRKISPFERALGAVCQHLPFSFRFAPLRRTVQQRNHRTWFPPFDFTRWQFFLNDTGRVPIAALAHRGNALSRFDLRPRLAQIGHPILLVHSEGEGRISSECLRELEQGLPNSRTEHLHTSGHLPYLTHPHRLTKLVRQFLVDPDESVAPAR